ncbi:unnamed protein product, partial [Ectocarpus sp. 8 AP-2014]
QNNSSPLPDLIRSPYDSNKEAPSDLAGTSSECSSRSIPPKIKCPLMDRISKDPRIRLNPRLLIAANEQNVFSSTRHSRRQSCVGTPCAKCWFNLERPGLSGPQLSSSDADSCILW